MTTPTATRWALLRQVGLATLDHAGDTARAAELLSLGPAFDDPELATLGLLDYTVPIGPEAYLEILAPATQDHSIARWLSSVGGRAGWVLSVQVPDLDGVRERAAEHGMRVAVDTSAMGHEIVQLHPKDAGVLLELDSFLPRESWFWDDLPSARSAQEHRTTAVIDIAGVEVAWPEPVALARSWAAVMGITDPIDTEDGAQLDLGGRAVRFVPSVDRVGLVGVDLVPGPAGPAAGTNAELCGVRVRFVGD